MEDPEIFQQIVETQGSQVEGFLETEIFEGCEVDKCGCRCDSNGENCWCGCDYCTPKNGCYRFTPSRYQLTATTVHEACNRHDRRHNRHHRHHHRHHQRQSRHQPRPDHHHGRNKQCCIFFDSGLSVVHQDCSSYVKVAKTVSVLLNKPERCDGDWEVCGKDFRLYKNI